MVPVTALTRVRSVANFPIGGGRMNVDNVTAVNEGVTTMVVARGIVAS